MNPDSGISPLLRVLRPASLLAFNHEAMACAWAFWLGGHDPAYLAGVAEELRARTDDLERKLSLYREGSDVWRINAAAAGTTLRLTDECMGCLRLALQQARASQGLFHPFLGREALAAKGQSHPLATPATSLCDPRAPVLQLASSGNEVRKLQDGPLLDLGAIAKGYALDELALTLEEWQVSIACLVAGGSSLRLLTPPQDMLGFEVECPALNRTLLLRNCALGASGSGFRPGHIIHPQHGCPAPAQRRCLLRADTAAEADALSTALLLAPPSLAADLVSTHPRLEALILESTTTLFASPLFR